MMLKTWSWGLVCGWLTVFQAPCSHTKQVGVPKNSIEENSNFYQENSKKAAPPSSSGEFADLLRKGSAEEIRQKLEASGLIKKEDRGSIKAGLRRFQEKHNLAKTGIPDHETIRQLGLNPEDMAALSQKRCQQ